MLIRAANPYRPGFAQSPAVLAGRHDVIGSIEEALDVAALDGRAPRPVLLVGSRGVGKTVLLAQARRIAAERHSWLSADAEVQPSRPVTPVLTARLAEVERLYEQTPTDRRDWRVERAVLRASLAGVGGEAELRRTAGPPQDDDLAGAVSRAVEAAAALDAGLLLTLDEVHLAAKDELAALAAVLQGAATRGWPLVAVMAGLPSVQDPRRMVTYLERAEWHSLGLLSEAESREALTGPAGTAGRPMDEEAAELLTGASGGYPYAIQVLGHHAWRASHGAERISAAHARAGEAAAQRDLAAGLYTARWVDSSDREKQYLAALARLVVDGGQPTGADVARALGQPAPAVSYLRARLLAKGTIYTQGRVLRFAVPGMAAWIADRAE